MLNVKDEVYASIESMSENVGDTYPKDVKKFPAVQYVEEENKVAEYTDNREQKAYIRYRFDIWDDISTSKHAVELDKCVSHLGLKRTQCMDLDDPSGLKHKQMRYEGIIDVNTKFVYHT